MPDLSILNVKAADIRQVLLFDVLNAAIMRSMQG